MARRNSPKMIRVNKTTYEMIGDNTIFPPWEELDYAPISNKKVQSIFNGLVKRRNMHSRLIEDEIQLMMYLFPWLRIDEHEP